MAHSSYAILKKSYNINRTIIGYPGIEAIFDAFGIIVDSIECFETPQWISDGVGKPMQF